MKRTLYPAAILCCVTSACAAASHGRYKASQTILVTGCVQNNGAKSSATMDGGYLLTNTVTGNAAGVRPSSPGSIGPPAYDDSPSGARPGSGGTGRSPQTQTTGSDDEMASHPSASYMLNGRDSELRNLIDKRAEITGYLETNVDEVGDSNATPTRGSVISHGRNTGFQWLRVLSVKVISSDCSARRSGSSR